LIRLIEWAGEFVGIGASRKMGKGRFRLARAAVRPVALAAE
jgi:CRISPR/Cas system endoribonuclease Cas6 (RAMP superfamily)